MLKQLSENYLLEIDRYIKHNLHTISCGEVRDCYQSFIDTSVRLTGVHANYKSLPEYIIHRFLFYLCKHQIESKGYAIVTNQKFLNKFKTGKNEIDIALVNPHKQGNVVGEPKLLRGISVKAAKTVKIDEDNYRANNVIWGTNEGMQFVLVTFNDRFNYLEDEYKSDKYEIINLQKESDKAFAHELKNKLCLSKIL
jgi:hypothetical protein